jgi:flagellar protein FliO/FliZ
MLQMIGSLALVVGVLGGVVWLLRRHARPVALSPGMLRIITTQSLGPRERLVVVEAGESWLVLGVTGQSITPLHSMPRQETATAGEAIARFDFSRLLSRALQSHVKN